MRPLEISGAVGIVQLKKLKSFIKARRENAMYFKSLFTNNAYVEIQEECGESSWFGFSLLIKENYKFNRKAIIQILKKNKVEVRPIVTGNFLKQPALKHINYKISGNAVSYTHLTLPTNREV